MNETHSVAPLAWISDLRLAVASEEQPRLIRARVPAGRAA